jgi:hypothetical protein
MSDRQKPKVPEVNLHLPPSGAKSDLKPVAGSNFDAANNWILSLAINALHLPADEREKIANQAVQTMVGLQPADEIEGMLCAQMVATNAGALEAMRRAFHPDAMLHSRMDWLNAANKLMRTHAALSEVLMRKRNGGQQRIVVERVQVGPGGQAVLGNVHQTLGGGCATEKATQSHEHATETGRLSAPCESPLQGAIEADQAKVRSPSGAR